MKLVSAKPDKTETLFCSKHGEYLPKITPYPLGNKFMVFESCMKCSEEENKLEQEREQAERQALYERMIIADKMEAGLGKRHLVCSFENYKTDTVQKELALEKTKKYIEGVLSGNGNCLVMAGKVGTGKTHLAAAMINTMVEKGKNSKLVKMSEVIRNIKSTWSKGALQDESEVIKFYSSLPLLIVDEIGVQFGTDTEKLLLSEIIDNRYQDILPTVLISNLDTDGIKNCIGERSYDRLRQDGGKVVAFDWESERGKA